MISISLCVKSASVRYGPCSRTTTRKPLVDSSFARTPPAAPEPTMTKSTSLEVLYIGWSTVISSPLPLPLLPNRDSPCRNSQKEAGTCARALAQSPSSQRRHDFRHNQDRLGNRRWCARGWFRRNSALQDARGIFAVGLWAARQTNGELRPA